MTTANRSFSLLASAARSADVTVDHHNDAWRGAVIVIDVTAVSGTPTITFTVQGVDPTTGKTWDILVSAAITAVGTTILRVHPDLTAAANQTAKDLLPVRWQLKCDGTFGGGESITFAVGVNYVV